MRNCKQFFLLMIALPMLEYCALASDLLEVVSALAHENNAQTKYTVSLYEGKIPKFTAHIKNFASMPDILTVSCSINYDHLIIKLDRTFSSLVQVCTTPLTDEEFAILEQWMDLLKNSFDKKYTIEIKNEHDQFMIQLISDPVVVAQDEAAILPLISIRASQFTAHQLVKLLKRFPDLYSLDLGFSEDIGEGLKRALTKNLQALDNLQEIYLSHCEIDEELLNKLYQHCLKLNKIKLMWPTNKD